LSDHLTHNQVLHYCRHELSAANLLSVSRHLEECNQCRRDVEAALSGDAKFLAVWAEVLNERDQLSPQHPTDEDLAAYVDRSCVDDADRTLADHLSACERCALAADDLRTLKDELAPMLDREYLPSGASVTGEPDRRRSFGLRLLSFPGSRLLAYAAAAVVLILLATMAWVILRQPNEEIKQDVSVPVPPIPENVPSNLMAQLKDGDRGLVTLDENGKLSGLDRLPQSYQQMAKEALTSQRVEPSSMLAGLARPGSALMSGADRKNDFSVIEPVGRVLLVDRPTFRWTVAEGTTSYAVEVYDQKFNLVASSPQLANNSWTAPESLARGGVYSWQVTATKAGEQIKAPRPPQPQAKFRVLDQATANEIAQARRLYGSSHLVLGLLYARSGLVEEAQQELRALERANPDSEIARKLLASASAVRR
jgi:hypothetical protein